MRYVLLDAADYGLELVEMTEEEHNVLANKDRYVLIGSTETIDDYLYRKWTVTDTFSLWIDDLAKKAEIQIAKRQAQLAQEAADEAARLVAIPPPTEAELAQKFIDLKASKELQISIALKNKLESGVLFNNKKVATDQFSLIVLNGAFALAVNNQWPVGQTFKLDGALEVVTNQDILSIFATVQQFFVEQYNREKELLDSLNLIVTLEALETFEVIW